MSQKQEYLSTFRAYLEGAFIGLAVHFLFVSIPNFIHRHYPAVAPLDIVIRWIQYQYGVGVMAAMALYWLLTLYLVVSDVRKFVRHVMPRVAEEAIASIATALASFVGSLEDIPSPIKLANLLCFSFLFYRTELISFHRPLLDNVQTVLEHVLPGFGVLFTLFLAGMVVMRVKQWWCAAAAARAAPTPTTEFAPPEVPVSVGVLVVEDEKTLVEEKTGHV
ncbi:hypothetical protein MSAN_00842100 [Mycena sanguinolenta]|uniref:Uncharacterized protein n=1 Tax=Mycena sanguinolenta TaxID=230812 RepID=A0A8H7DAY7_9AGAR|nr:hypothetical protein MSAN_00842100 [Mycena sanguinolenta]